MSPKELDMQSPVVIDKWIDINSDQARMLDDDLDLSKKMMRIGLEANMMFFDNDGRMWGRDEKKSICYPFHFESGKKLIGYRSCKKAAN